MIAGYCYCVFFFEKKYKLGFELELRTPWSDFIFVGLFEKPISSTFAKYEDFFDFRDSSQNGSHDPILNWYPDIKISLKTPYFAAETHRMISFGML